MHPVTTTESDSTKRAPWAWKRAGAIACLAGLCLAAGCSSILPEKEPPAKFYSLDYLPGAAPGAQAAPPAGAGNTAGAVILITAPRAAPGFDRSQMVYVRQPHQIEYFAQNQWVESPPRMLAPLMQTALERSGAFRAVLQTPSSAPGEMRLSTEIIRLQQEFFGSPSQVRFTLRARLIDDATRKVIASREFEAVADAPSANPYGGVQAANVAVNKVLVELAAFCAENARNVAGVAAK